MTNSKSDPGLDQNLSADPGYRSRSRIQIQDLDPDRHQIKIDPNRTV